MKKEEIKSGAVMTQFGSVSSLKQNINEKYKDTIFKELFREKSRTVELCNALLNTNYPDNSEVINGMSAISNYRMLL